ncbi:Yip1 family protein [Desulforamulus ferrireducens]|uniref:YIP1 family protein n=1 Tax=Desulforamulus ferrireducens TaxID=1833852 RepID=A0A1S6J063_9FIRM|nr:Yip1 family protein [Desulforamulus ferrireducens]AQS60405.1 YIP1 family protein [Desulforamulus ferrireducens]
MDELRDNRYDLDIAEPVTTPVAEPPPPPLKYYDIIYGVLFEPVPTMKRVAQQPPLAATLVIVIAMTLIGLLTSLYTSAHGGPANLGLEMGLPLAKAKRFSEALRAAAPMLAILGALFFFVKWFFYSALLHLLADFYGGKGNARTVFVVYGLSCLPTVFLIPLEVLTTIFLPSLATLTTTLASLIVFVWGFILLTIGIREAHLLSTGRTVAVILTPVAVVVLLFILTVVGLVSTLSAFMPVGW